MKSSRRRRKANLGGSEGVGARVIRTYRGDDTLSRIERADLSRQSHLDGDITIEGSSIRGTENTEIGPLYSFGLIDRVCKMSNMLPQCLDAMKTNVGGYGYRVVPIAPGREELMDEREVDLLTSWIERPNVDQSLMLLTREQVYYYEKYGFEMYEVIRDRKLEPSLLKAVNVATMRATQRQSDPVLVERWVQRAEGNRVKVVERRRFRKYVQRIGNTTVWFKEWGDPRTMDWRTGEYQSRKTGRIPEQFQATEILHFKQESEDVYGLPRWINQIRSILGSHESEIVNVRYFQENTIPPAILTVSGGRLTHQSFQEARRLIEQGGIDKQFRLLLLEAIAETEGVDDTTGTVKIDLKKLTDARPSDALFKDYDEANQAKIRSAFRLPPLIFGMAQETTFASAQVSVFLAELQVFQPERALRDERLNKYFVNNEHGLNLKTVKLEAKGPQLTQPDSIVKALSAANAMGAVTPRTAVKILNEHLQINLPQYPEQSQEGYFDWMDQPLQFSLRQIGRNDNDVNRTREEEDMDEEGSEERESAREGNVTSFRQRRRKG